MTKYEGNGIVKRVKTPVKQTYEPFEKVFDEPALDESLAYADFDKIMNNKFAQICFRAISGNPKDIKQF